MSTAVAPIGDPQRLRTHYLAHGAVMSIHFDLLYACDLDCPHCYLEDKKRRQVPTRVVIDTLRQAADLGALKVLFSGGEIFLRKDLFEILEAARALRYRIRLKTHGGNITPDIARRLAELQVAGVDFSVYALNHEIHDRFTKVPGSLKRTLAGIQHLIDAGIHVEIRCPVGQYNVHEYRELTNHFEDQGVPVSFQADLRATNSHGLDPIALNVEHEDRVRLEVYRIYKYDEYEPRTTPLPPSKTSNLCGAGHTSLYISPDLDVYPCVSFPKYMGNLLEQSLDEIWRTSPEFEALRKLRRSDTGHCRHCAARPHCAFCPGKIFLATGDPTTPPPEVCAVAFARLEARERYLEGEQTLPHLAPEPRTKKAHFPIMGNAATTTAGGCGC